MSAHIDIVFVHVRDKEAAKLLHREKFGFEQCATPQAQERVFAVQRVPWATSLHSTMPTAGSRNNQVLDMSRGLGRNDTEERSNEQN